MAPSGALIMQHLKRRTSPEANILSQQKATRGLHIHCAGINQVNLAINADFSVMLKFRCLPLTMHELFAILS
jgi:hypothetical protein